MADNLLTTRDPEARGDACAQAACLFLSGRRDKHHEHLAKSEIICLKKNDGRNPAPPIVTLEVVTLFMLPI